MDLFGFKAHEETHEETARILRRLVEQVSQLTINLGQTRVDLRKLALKVEGKIDAGDVDPVILGINQALADARIRLTEAAAAAEDQWNTISEELEDAIEDVNEKTESLPEE